MFDLPDKAESNSRSDYVWKWKTATSEAYRIAHEATTKSAEKRKKNYHDRRIRYTDIQPGDRVLVRNLSPRGRTGETSSILGRRSTRSRFRKGTRESSLRVKTRNRTGT